MLPPFTEHGLLPVGDKGHWELTFDELRDSKLVKSPCHMTYPDWDDEWRLQLVNNAETLVKQLWQVGITDVFLDGSFAEDKNHPNDIDGYFECDATRFRTGELHRELNLLDPNKIWTWSPQDRIRVPDFQKLMLPMWVHYRVELFPHWPNNLCGITDEFGNNLEFPAAFRKSRNKHMPKGIIKVIK